MLKYLGVGRYTSDGLNGLAREGVLRRRATPMSLRERTRPGLGPKFFARLPAATFGILGVAVVAGQPTSATAQSYPWCAQGDSIVHCYYTTREQCEEAVNHHGICIANSSAPTSSNEAPQPRVLRRR